MPSKFKKTPATVAITGAYGYGNFGDDALMIASKAVVSRAFPDAECVFVGKSASYAEKILPGVRWVDASDGDFVLADLAIYGGGTQFYSFPLTCRTKQVSFLRRVLNNLRTPKAFWKKCLRKLGVSKMLSSNSDRIAIGIGLGPFVENSQEVIRTRREFSRLEFVSVRDIASYQLCRAWNCANLSLGADLCYLPGLWESPTSPHKPAGQRKIRRVGVIIRDWPHTLEGDSYSEALFEVVATLRAEGTTVQFICFAESQDSLWIQRLAERAEDFLSWHPESVEVPQFLSVLDSFDLLITARYHGAVFSSMIGKPVVCIEVEPKLRLVAELLEPGARLWAQPFLASECLRQISELEANYSQAVDSLAEVSERQGQLVEDMIAQLRRPGFSAD